jgi:DNA-binding MarR family transcriptional regulator
MARLYRRTDAGRKAWDTQAADVPLDYRRVLGLVGDESDPKDVCARLGWSEYALDEVLEELEQAGMVERLETDDSDLDFTGAFSAARFAAGKKTS